jgi:hypothetical protein
MALCANAAPQLELVSSSRNSVKAYAVELAI